MWRNTLFQLIITAEITGELLFLTELLRLKYLEEYPILDDCYVLNICKKYSLLANYYALYI